jgi:hypothetical protein
VETTQKVSSSLKDRLLNPFIDPEFSAMRQDVLKLPYETLVIFRK